MFASANYNQPATSLLTDTLHLLTTEINARALFINQCLHERNTFAESNRQKAAIGAYLQQRYLASQAYYSVKLNLATTGSAYHPYLSYRTPSHIKVIEHFQLFNQYQKALEKKILTLRSQQNLLASLDDSADRSSFPNMQIYFFDDYQALCEIESLIDITRNFAATIKPQTLALQTSIAELTLLLHSLQSGKATILQEFSWLQQLEKIRQETKRIIQRSLAITTQREVKTRLGILLQEVTDKNFLVESIVLFPQTFIAKAQEELAALENDFLTILKIAIEQAAFAGDKDKITELQVYSRNALSNETEWWLSVLFLVVRLKHSEVACYILNMPIDAGAPEPGNFLLSYFTLPKDAQQTLKLHTLQEIIQANGDKVMQSYLNRHFSYHTARLKLTINHEATRRYLATSSYQITPPVSDTSSPESGSFTLGCRRK